MMTPTQQDLERCVVELAARIGASGRVPQLFGFGEGPHIEIGASELHYVIEERGSELTRVTSSDPYEILWHVFRDITFSVAVDYAAAHRDRDKDPRRLIFARQLQLLEQLSPAWAKRKAAEHRDTLDQHPFDDDKRVRNEYEAQLRRSGRSPTEAIDEACAAYPLPRRRVLRDA